MKLFAAVLTNIASVKEAILTPTSSMVAFATEIEAMETSIQLGFRGHHILACEFDSKLPILRSSLVYNNITRRQSSALLSLAKQAGFEKSVSSFEGASILTAFESFKTLLASAGKRGSTFATFLSEFCRIIKCDAAYADSDCTQIVMMNPLCVKSFNPWRKDGDVLPIFESFESLGVKAVDCLDSNLCGTYFAPAKEAFELARSVKGEVCADDASSWRCVSDSSDEEKHIYQVRYVDGSIVMAPALPWQLSGAGGYEDEPLSSFMAWDDKDFSRIVDIVEQYNDGDGEFAFFKAYDRKEDMDDIERCRCIRARPAVKAREADRRFSAMFDRVLYIRRIH